MGNAVMASIRIHLPTALRERSHGISPVVVEAHSVADALRALAEQYPEVGRLIFREPGTLRPHVNVFVDDDRIGHDDASALSDGDELRIVPSIAGG